MLRTFVAEWHQRMDARGGPSHAVGRTDAVIARDGELSRVQLALAAGRSVLVFGPMGAGKTHLVDAFAASSAFYVTPAPGARAERTATDGPDAPVWVSVRGDRPPGAGPLAALLSVLPDVDIDPAAPLGVVRGAVLRSLRVLTAGRPVIVRVDGAEHLDPLSAAVLAGLARQEDLQLVATLREHVAGRSPWVELWRDGVADRIDLAPLTRAQVDSWVIERLGGSVSAEAAYQLWRASAANPLQLVESTSSALQSGTLRQESGVWLWSGDLSVSTRMTELVLHEISGLDASARRALELVAVARGMDRDVLERIVAPPVVDALLEEGHVAVRYARQSRARQSRAPQLRCSPLYARVLQEHSTLAQRREIISTLRMIRGEIETSSESALMRTVAAALECGLTETPERVVLALEAGLRAGNAEFVARLATLALPVVGRGTPARLDVLRARAVAWRFLDRPEKCLQDVAQVRAEIDQVPLDDAAHVGHVLAMAETQAAIEQYHHDDLGAALGTLAFAYQEVAARLGGVVPPALALRFQVMRIVCVGCAGRFDEVRPDALAVLAGPAGGSPAVLPLVPLVVMDLTQVGRLHEAQDLAQQYTGVALADVEATPWAAAEILSAGYLALIGLGEVEQAETVVAMLSDDDVPFNTERITGHLVRGGLATLRGRWSDARSELHSANVQLGISDVLGLSAMSLVSEAVAAIASGDAASGRALVARAERAPARLFGAYTAAEIRLLHLDAQAWLRAPDLYERALALADWARARGLQRVELDALHRAVLALHADGRTARGSDLLERAHAVAAGVDGRRAQALLAHVTAMFTADRDLIMVASRELCERGVWLPLTQPAVALTRREQEIAGLAAGGLSSKQIAERLVLSVRTVDSHLSRIFAKAGVRNRRELAAVLRG